MAITLVGNDYYSHIHVDRTSRMQSEAFDEKNTMNHGPWCCNKSLMKFE